MVEEFVASRNDRDGLADLHETRDLYLTGIFECKTALRHCKSLVPSRQGGIVAQKRALFEPDKYVRQSAHIFTTPN